MGINYASSVDSDLGIGGTPKLIYMTMALWANETDATKPDGWLFCSQETLARRAGIDRSYARAIIKELVRTGRVVITKRGSKRLRTANEYRVKLGPFSGPYQSPKKSIRVPATHPKKSIRVPATHIYSGAGTQKYGVPVSLHNVEDRKEKSKPQEMRRGEECSAPRPQKADGPNGALQALCESSFQSGGEEEEALRAGEKSAVPESEGERDNSGQAGSSQESDPRTAYLSPEEQERSLSYFDEILGMWPTSSDRHTAKILWNKLRLPLELAQKIEDDVRECGLKSLGMWAHNGRFAKPFERWLAEEGWKTELSQQRGFLPRSQTQPTRF